MLLSRVLFDDGDYVLQVGLFGGMAVYSKNLERSFRPPSDERAYFRELCDELEKRQIPISPDSKGFREACEDFCDAATRPRNSAGWRAYFRYPASQKADRIATLIQTSE
jgi:hypothetical protein